MIVMVISSCHGYFEESLLVMSVAMKLQIQTAVFSHAIYKGLYWLPLALEFCAMCSFDSILLVVLHGASHIFPQLSL